MIIFLDVKLLLQYFFCKVFREDMEINDRPLNLRLRKYFSLSFSGNIRIKTCIKPMPSGHPLSIQQQKAQKAKPTHL